MTNAAIDDEKCFDQFLNLQIMHKWIADLQFHWLFKTDANYKEKPAHKEDRFFPYLTKQRVFGHLCND